MNIGNMLTAYRDSHFKARDYVPAERIAAPLEQARAMTEYLANPLSALKANVEQSRLDVEVTADRMERAKYDGILDRDIYRGATKEEKEEWRKAVKMLKGDHQRAISELAHWREYVGLAMNGELPMPKRAANPRNLAREIADAKSYPPDPRLPPEHEEEAPF